jgi:hypothetical protein
MLSVCQHYARLNVANLHHFSYHDNSLHAMCLRVSQLYLRSTVRRYHHWQRNRRSRMRVPVIDEALAASSKLFGMTR